MNPKELIDYALNFLQCNLEDADVYDIVHGPGTADNLTEAPDCNASEWATANGKIDKVRELVGMLLNDNLPTA